MASIVLQPVQKFPVGTSVAAYKRSNWPGYQQQVIAGSPVGSSDATASVASDGSLTFTGLADNTRYVAYASVSSEDRYLGFTTGNPQALGSDQGSPGSPAPAEAELVGGKDASGNLQALAAALLADNLTNPTTALLGSLGMLWDVQNSQWRRAASARPDGSGVARNSVQQVSPSYANGANLFAADAAVAGDGQTGNGFGLASTALFNGLTFDKLRTPNVFKSFASTAITAGTGATIWTPAAGKKFRLMGWAISSSAAGVIILGDNAVGTVIARSPAVAAAGFFQLGAADMGNGILSAAANNVLKVDGPTGNVAGMVWGCEE